MDSIAYKLAFLRISTFIGFGGEHWYGDIAWKTSLGYHHADVTYRLTSAEAKRMNKGIVPVHKEGDVCFRFETKEKLILTAYYGFRDIAPGTTTLILGAQNYYEPGRAIYGDYEITNTINGFVDRIEALEAAGYPKMITQRALAKVYQEFQEYIG